MSVENLFRELSNSDETEINMTDKQISIISAAIEIFAEKGYSATSTSEIAKQAGVGEGTIFHHYKTKKDLLLSIPGYLSMLSFSKTFPDNISNIFEYPYENFGDFLRDFISNRKKFIADNLVFIKVLFQEFPFHPELRTKVLELILTPGLTRINAIINRYREKGQIGDIPNESIVSLILSTIFGYLFTNYIINFGFYVDTEKETDYLIQYIINGIGNAGR